MAAFARGFLYIFVIQIYQVSSSQPVSQYVLSNYAPANGPTQPIPRPAQSIVSLPAPSKALQPKAEVAGPLDTHVLNNLAIALQLLIVSNILNIPPEREFGPKYERISAPKSEASLKSYPADLQLILEQALSKPSLYSLEAHGITKPSLYSYEAPLPNANYLGSSGFSEPSFGSSVGFSKPNPRTSMMLMSPYDALGTSLFGDTLPSLTTSYSKNDFQSPYASILAADGANNLFSTTDFF